MRIHSLLLCLGFVIPAAAQVSVSPSQDLQSLVSSNPAGTQFILRAGTHRLRSVAPKDGNKFTGEPGAILSGAKELTGFMQEGNVWVVYGQTQEASGRDVGMCYEGPRCTYPEDLFLDDKPLLHVSRVSDLGAGKWFFDYQQDKIYIGENPNGRRVETSVTAHAFASSARNVVIEKLIIEKYATAAQRGTVQPYPALGGIFGGNWVVQDCEIRYNHGTGLRTGTSMQVLRNKIHHNGQMGLAGTGGDVVIDGNEIAYNNNLGYDYGWEAGGSKFSRTWNLTVRGNNVHDNKGPGLHSDIDNTNSLFENNTTSNNLVAGIYIELSFNTTIRNNTMTKEGFSVFGTELWWGAAILMNSSGDIDIYGNTIKDCANAVGAVQSNRGWSNALSRWYWDQNISVHENTIINPSYTAGGIIRSGDSDDGVFGRNNRWYRNSYQVSNLNGRYFQWSGGGKTWSEWRNSGQDTDGSLGNIVTSTPSTPPDSIPSTPTTPSTSSVYLSELPRTYEVSGWGPVEKDRSNGDLAGGDGGTLTVQGTTFAKGLGVHAYSDLRFNIGGKYQTFTASVGVDDEITGTRGSVIFEVWADGAKIYDSGPMYGNTTRKQLSVNVSGKSELRLVVTNGGDNNYYDHADWGDAKLNP